MIEIINNLDKEPMIQTYSDIVYEMCVITKEHPAFNNWILTEMTQLICDERKKRKRLLR